MTCKHVINHAASLLVCLMLAWLSPTGTTKASQPDGESVDWRIGKRSPLDSTELRERITAFQDEIVQFVRSGEYDLAADFMMKKIESAGEEFGNNSDLVLWYQFHAAETLEMMGRYEEAELLYKRMLAIVEEMKGPNNYSNADLLTSLAQIYIYQEKYAEAEPLYKRVLSIKERKFGPESPRIVGPLLCMARNYNYQKKYTDAEPLLIRALSILQNEEKEAYVAAECMNMLALVHEKQGRYQEAESCYRQVLAYRERSRGMGSNNLITCLNNLARVCCAQGKYEDAESIYKRTLAIREDMPDMNQSFYKGVLIADCLANLRTLYESTGRDEDAGIMQQRIDAIAVSPQEARQGLSMFSGRCTETNVNGETKTMIDVYAPPHMNAGDEVPFFASRIPGVQILELGDCCQISDSGMRYIQDMSDLEVLTVTGEQITDLGVERICGLKKLRSLQLNNTAITDAGLERVSKMTGLRQLTLLGNTNITDIGLEYLTTLNNLELLCISHCPITDAGLVYLEKLESLKTLTLVGTKVTVEATKQLRARRPDLALPEITDRSMQRNPKNSEGSQKKMGQ